MRLVLMLYLFLDLIFLSKIMGEFAFIIWIADEQKDLCCSRPFGAAGSCLLPR